MPSYDYSCKECGNVFEITHGMNERPSLMCPRCRGKNIKRAFSVPNLGRGRTLARGRVEDHGRRHDDMKTDLRENHGVENAVPLGRNTLSDVYGEVKANPSMVKERMQRSEAEAQQKRDAKRKAWTEKANQRLSRRNREVAERKAADAAKQRRITMT